MSKSASAYSYAAAGVVRRPIRLLVTWRPMARVSAFLLPALDRAVFKITRGSLTFSAWVTGLPILLLTTKGARTGEPRTTRVLGIPDGGGFIIVAANFGQRVNPAWYYNLRAHPEVSLAMDDTQGTYYARELFGAERERGFQQAVALNPGWRRFQKQAGERVIPVVRLDVV